MNSMACHPRATCHIAGCKNSIRHIENRFSPYFIFTGRPVRSAAMPVLFCSEVQKWVFRPAGATRCPDKREIWHGEWTAAPCQILRLSGQKCGKTAPKTVKMSNFGHKFTPQGRLVCFIFTIFSAFIRVYR